MNFVERSLSDVTKQKMKEMKMKLKRYDSSTIELDEIDPEPSENNPTIQEFINVFSQEINYTIRPNLSEEETTEIQQTLLEFVERNLNSVKEGYEQQIHQLKVELQAETDIRTLTESYQSELESYVESLRSLNMKPMKKPEQSKSQKLFPTPEMTEYELQINQLEANADYLRKELARLQEIYCSMVESRAVLYFEKESLKLELENLTRELFEEANRMVANETRLRAEFQSSNQKLSQELESALQNLRQIANAQKEKYFQAQRRQSQSPPSLSPTSPRLNNFSPFQKTWNPTSPDLDEDYMKALSLEISLTPRHKSESFHESKAYPQKQRLPKGLESSKVARVVSSSW